MWRFRFQALLKVLWQMGQVPPPTPWLSRNWREKKEELDMLGECIGCSLGALSLWMHALFKTSLLLLPFYCCFINEPVVHRHNRSSRTVRYYLFYHTCMTRVRTFPHEYVYLAWNQSNKSVSHIDIRKPHIVTLSSSSSLVCCLLPTTTMNRAHMFL